MVVMGGSAGGYTVLLSMALHPDVFAAGVDLYGVADLFALSEDTHRFEAHYLDTIVGPLPETYARYRERSPVNLADKIARPLLILQGDKDEVVPLAWVSAVAGPDGVVSPATDAAKRADCPVVPELLGWGS